MREFVTKPKPPPNPIEFSIDGRVMEFRSPGWAPILLAQSEGPLGVTRTYLDWIGAGLSDEDGQWILDRLLDPNDEYDFPDLQELILGIMEDVSGRPTEPPTDSSPSAEANGSTAGRHHKELTPTS